MSKAPLGICILLCLFASLAPAQDLPLPPATVGVPYTFDVEPDLAELIALFDQIGAQLSVTITLVGSPPPGLTVQSQGLISGTPTAAGIYNFVLNERFRLDYEGQTIIDESFPISCSLEVIDFKGQSVSVDPGSLSFTSTQASTASLSQTVVVSNRNKQAQNISVTTDTNSGGKWLSASGGGSVSAFGTSSITVTVDPRGLPAGTYAGTVSMTISPAALNASVAVLLTLSSSQRQIQLSQTGLRFQTVAGGAVPTPQSVSVLNSGSGSLSFSASTSTVTGGTWLSVSPTAGVADSSSSPTLSVRANPAGLTPGDYYGTVAVSAGGVDNSPQTLSVVFNVAPVGTDLGAFVQPAGLIFIASAGGTNPASKTISITNPSPAPLTFTAALFFGQDNKWFTVQPSSGTVSATSPAQLVVQPTITGLTAGVYTGDLTLFFNPSRVVKHVAIVLVVTSSGSTAEPTATSRVAPLAAGCIPTKLVPVFTQLGAGFATVAAWPTPIEATVVDDCGAFMTSGNVVASFSSGDPALSLVSLRDGRWSATWQPRSSASQVTITVKAQQIAPPLQGSQAIGGALAENPVTPAIAAGGVTSAAGGVLHEALSPGSFISIYGTHLSAGQNISNALPFPTQLGATQVIIAGRQLPLYFAADGQINAIIPYDVPVNTTQQLIVTNGPAISVPEPVVISSVHPAVFTRLGTAAAYGYKPDGTKFLVDTAHPVSAGDIIEVYCTGLGPVDQPVIAGTASPLANTTNAVTVKVGGKDSKVLFAGLAPGLAGVYQLDATIPSGVTAGNDVPLVVIVAGEQSAPVTMPVR
jgi:uncharacterized protein (TIGR03437 family)